MEANKTAVLSQLIDDLLRDHEFGEPWRLGEDNAGIVVPVLRVTNIPETRGYNVLEEVKDKVTIQDTGSINHVKVKGNIDRPVFIRGGGVLEGKGTQSRAVQFGTVIMPEKEQLVPVLCVHASHGIRHMAFFSHKGYAPRLVTQALSRRNQSATWGAVNLYAANAAQSLRSAGVEPSAHFADDDLVRVSETVEKFRTDVEEAMKKIPGDLENQVGVAIFDLSGPLGIEVFDHPESWHALSKSVVRQYTDVIVEKIPDYLEINMDKVLTGITSFLERAKNVEQEAVHLVDGARTILIRGDVVGEYTLLGDRSIHLLLTRKEKEAEQPREIRRMRQVRGIIGPETRPSQYPNRRESPMAFPGYTTYPMPPEQFFRRRGGFKFLSSLSDGPKAWSEISDKFRSTNTLSRRLQEATDLGFVQKSARLENGREVYKLTQTGQAALKKAEKLYAQ